MRYPAKFQPEPEGGFTVTFRDVPEAITHGRTMEEAEDLAADALLTSMDFYFEDNRPVSPPSAAKRGERMIALPASAAAKVLLLNEVLAQRVTRADLARRLVVVPQTVSRLFDLHHATKIDAIDDALRVLGKRLALGLEDA